MKRIISLILSAALLLLFPSSVLAHPGRTDIYGGHYNDETGEYHYHHGFPAHQHIDGECPYDFVDAADHTSSTTSTILSNGTDDYTRGYQQGFARGQENAEYTDGYQDGEAAGYQTGIEEERKKHFQYYPLVIFSISIIASIAILSLIASRQKIKSDYRIKASDNEQQIQHLTLKYQKEIEEHQKDRLEMKSAYEKLIDAQKQIFSSKKNDKSADQRVKSCEQFIAMFGGSAEEFFAHQDAPQRLAKMQADYLTLVYEASAIYLENKERPAYKEAQRIRELKADTAKYIERMKKAEYECDQLREQLRIAKKVYSVSDHTET